MRSTEIFSLLVLIFLTISLPTRSELLYSGEEKLDGDDYVLKWRISDLDEIHFHVYVRTLGYVGLGISPTGGMVGADIFIGGVYDNGTGYSYDTHAVAQASPSTDYQSDWILDDSSQSDTHTTLQFHRLLNTCDEEEDYAITPETLRIIWSVGKSDRIEFHERKGTKSINFFLPDDGYFDKAKYDKYDIIANSVMPAQDTSYLCTFHEGPTITDERHYVAFEPVLNNPLALEHTHHYSIFRCIAPEGKTPEEVFGPFVNQTGKHCYGDYPIDEFPIAYCNNNLVFGWSKGGKRMVFPPEIGYPIPGRRDQKEYYAMEVHYDNPREDGPPAFETGARMYYTKKDELREIEAGVLVIIHDFDAQLTIPPKSENYVVAGHCSSECTEAHLPDEGITIFINLFHSHLAGRKMKLRHFRGDEELPWIDVDDHYDFDYQQTKPLSNPVKILKGDQLTVECTYSNSGDRAVIGGLSTKEEMCEVTMYVYPKPPLWLCASSQNLDGHFELLGMTNVTVKPPSYPGGLPSYEIDLPENLSGDYLESVSSKVEWSDEFRKEYQEEKRFGVQVGTCRNEGLDSTKQGGGNVKYPGNFVEYVPTNECTGGGGGGTEFLRPNYKGITLAFLSLYVFLNR